MGERKVFKEKYYSLSLDILENQPLTRALHRPLFKYLTAQDCPNGTEILPGLITYSTFNYGPK